MYNGFIKVAAMTPDILVGDVEYNTEQIISGMKKAAQSNGKLVVFPELCMTGYTCNDLFLQDVLLENVYDGIQKILAASVGLDILTVIGFPFYLQNSLYNVAANNCASLGCISLIQS